jgi:RNA polymerase sigma factor (sigma-70 family)
MAGDPHRPSLHEAIESTSVKQVERNGTHSASTPLPASVMLEEGGGTAGELPSGTGPPGSGASTAAPTDDLSHLNDLAATAQAALLKEEDDGPFTELIPELVAILSRAYRRCDPVEFEDLKQTVLMKLVRAFRKNKYKTEKSFVRYFRSIAANARRDQFRAKRREPRQLTEVHSEQLADPTPERDTDPRSLLDDLGVTEQEDRDLMVWYHVCRLTQVEIATTLGVAPSTVCRRLEEIRERITRLEEQS